MDQSLSSQQLRDSHTLARRPAASVLARPAVNSRSRAPEPESGASLILSRDELESLTGFRQSKRMCEWLEQRTWVFEAPCRRGELPKVDRTYYLSRMSGVRSAPTRKASPLFDFLMGGRT